MKDTNVYLLPFSYSNDLFIILPVALVIYVQAITLLSKRTTYEPAFNSNILTSSLIRNAENLTL